MVTYGDGVTNIDVAKLLAFHKEHKRLATVTTVRVPGRFGVIETTTDGQVKRFREKPTDDAYISAGFFIFEPRVFEYLSTADECMLEREPLERLVRDNQLMSFKHDGDFHPMDTYRDYVALNDLWSSGKAPWKIW